LAVILALVSAVWLAPEALALGKSPQPTPAPSAPGAPAPSPPATSPPAKATTAPAPSQPVEGAIAAPNIPLEADRLLTVLRNLEERLAPTPAVSAVERGLPAMAERIADAQTETKGQLSAASSLSVLTNLSDLWAGMQIDLKTWADQLRVKATEVGSILDQLADLADTWSRTREEARRTLAPPTLINRVDEAIAQIAALRKTAAERRTALLTLQVKVGEQLAAVQESAAAVAQATNENFSTLFRADRLPIWYSWRDAPPLAELPGLVRDSAAPQLAVLARFAADRSRAMVFHGLIFLALVAFALTGRRRARAWAASGSVDPTLRVFEFPVSTALIVGLMMSDWLYVRQPMIAVNLIGVVLLLPVVRILKRMALPGQSGLIWVATAFFVLNRLRDLALLNAPLAEQEMVLLLSIGGAAAILWLWRRGALVVGDFAVPGFLVWVGVGALLVSFAVGAFGYMRLARLLNGGILRGLYTALGLYAGLLVTLGVFAYLLRVWPLSGLHMVTRYRALFERRAEVVLRWAMSAVWIFVMLRWFGLLDEGESLVTAVLGFHFTRGFVSISLGDIIGLILTVWIAFSLSRFLRFALEEDVYPRLPMGRGLPYAISSLLHYVILLLGFLVAIGAMGVDLNRLTLLTGAFGVGVGFGLQTIVSNFVSGIILLLERPIQVGDAIQMGDLDGEVRRIGIRSTTVHTWRGAEVLVPNATLISGNLTNWTLSDRTRRLELPIGVAYGSDPERVIALLVETATTVPGVLAKPSPLALFQSFGDSALNFELRAWTDHFEEWGAIRSHIAVAVNNRLKAEGIEIPFPQRDVNLHYPPREET
jgi:small-conductance mechanosensitive channel